MSSVLLLVAPQANACQATQMWACEVNDEATEESVEEHMKAWLKAARAMPGGAQLEARILHPVAVNATRELDFFFVVTAPSFEEWGKFWDAYPDSPAAAIEEDKEGRRRLSGQRLVAVGRAEDGLCEAVRHGALGRSDRDWPKLRAAVAGNRSADGRQRRERGDADALPVVWSCNEWDALEEVVVGNSLGARFPTADPSTRGAEFPERPLDEIPRGPFPQEVIDATEEDLGTFIETLEALDVTVRRPETWPYEATFSTIHWESRRSTTTARATSCSPSAITSSRRRTSSAAAHRRPSAIAP